MVNVGKWASWHQGVVAPTPYADTLTYKLGADWLATCSLVEDWGCGLGWLRTMIPPERYRGIDGTQTPFTDEVVDLTTYQSHVPGVFMRHVLEHNRDWRDVLDNAMASFTERMVLILFTPMAQTTHEVAWYQELEVPDIAFRHEDIVARFASDTVSTFEDYATKSQYGCERVYLLQKGHT